MIFRCWFFYVFIAFWTKEVYGFPSLFTHDPVQDEEQEEAPAYQLSGILYYDLAHWTIWINGTAIQAETARENADYIIEEVTPSHVTLRVREEEGEAFVTKVLRVP